MGMLRLVPEIQQQIRQINLLRLRHTFGSQMAMAGAEPFAIMKAMGYTDMKTTVAQESTACYIMLQDLHTLRRMPWRGNIRWP